MPPNIECERCGRPRVIVSRLNLRALLSSAQLPEFMVTSPAQVAKASLLLPPPTEGKTSRSVAPDRLDALHKSSGPALRKPYGTRHGISLRRTGIPQEINPCKREDGWVYFCSFGGQETGTAKVFAYSYPNFGIVQRMWYSRFNAHYFYPTRKPDRNRRPDRDLLGNRDRIVFAKLPVAKECRAYQWGHFSELHHTRDDQFG